MSDGEFTSEQEQNSQPSASRRLTDSIADAFTFIRSAEVNKAMGSVSMEQLIGDQIARNGETDRSNASQYDPYGYNPKAAEKASQKNIERANFLGGTDTNRPTKLDRLLAIVNSLSKAIDEVESVEVPPAEAYAEQATVAPPESE